MRITHADFDFWSLHRAPRWWTDRTTPYRTILPAGVSIHHVINGHADTGREPDGRREAGNMIHTLRLNRRNIARGAHLPGEPVGEWPRTLLQQYAAGDYTRPMDRKRAHALRWLRRLERAEANRLIAELPLIPIDTRRGGR